MISISLIKEGGSLLCSARDLAEETQQKIDEYLQGMSPKFFRNFRKDILNEFGGFQVRLDRLIKQERKDDAWRLNVEDEEAYIRCRCSEMQDHAVRRVAFLLRERFCCEQGASNEQAMSQIEKFKVRVKQGGAEWERRQRVLERIKDKIRKVLIHVVSVFEQYRMILSAMPCLDLQERVKVHLDEVGSLRGSIRELAREVDQITSSGNESYLKIDSYRKENLIRDYWFDSEYMVLQLKKAISVRTELRKMWDCMYKVSCGCRSIHMQLGRVVVRAKEESRALVYFLSLKKMLSDPCRLSFCYSSVTQIGISIRFFGRAFSARVMTPKWDRFLVLEEGSFCSPCLSREAMTTWLGQIKNRFSVKEMLPLSRLHFLYREEEGSPRLLLLPCMKAEKEPLSGGSLPFEPSVQFVNT